MRVKTSITLTPETLRLVDRMGGRRNRSRTIEEAIHYLGRERERLTRDARDREIIDRVSDRLNAEMADVLELQGEP